MPEIYRATDVEEAVELANRFREEGRYDWFRSQVKDWPPYSSSFRIGTGSDRELEARSQRRAVMFLKWLSDTPQLRDLLSNIDAPGAVAQHYGIPTNYIDFTTEPGVAGFFAADSQQPPEENALACIYCLDTKDLLEVWEMMKDVRTGAHLELIKIDVSNLWRLEAQHGCFLFCDYNWDVDYPMDRILFPQTGYPSWPTKELIYPPQKSPLELLIDHYLDIEQKVFGSEWLRQTFKVMQAEGRNVAIHNDSESSLGFRTDALRGTDIPPLASWQPARLEDWNGFATERMEETIGAPVILQVKPGQPADMAKSVAYGVRQFLNTRKRARRFIYSWQLQGLTIPPSLKVEALSSYLQTLWNGMRSLPYTDDDIATACGVTTNLFLEGLSNYGGLASAQKVLGDCFEVEFATREGSSSRGYLRRETLRSSLRSDLDEFISDHQKEMMASDIRRVLLGIFSPNLLIEFDHLQAIFARELIPTQVLTRSLVLYSPAQLSTFGLP